LSGFGAALPPVARDTATPVSTLPADVPSPKTSIVQVWSTVVGLLVVIPGNVGPARREMHGIAGLQDGHLPIDLDRERAFEDEEHLLAFVRGGLGADAGRVVQDDAAQHVPGNAAERRSPW
jgi:hypothetical protein